MRKNTKAGEIRELRSKRKMLEERMDKIWVWCLKNINHPDWITQKREFNNLSVKIEYINNRIKDLQSNTDTRGVLQEHSFQSGCNY